MHFLSLTQVSLRFQPINSKFSPSRADLDKILIRNNLKDENTKLPTQRAIKEKIAKVQGKKVIKTLWDIDKLEHLFRKDYVRVAEVEFWTNKLFDSINSFFKLKQLSPDTNYGKYVLEFSFYSTPREYRDRVFREIIVNKLDFNNALQYDCIMQLLLGYNNKKLEDVRNFLVDYPNKLKYFDKIMLLK